MVLANLSTNKSTKASLSMGFTLVRWPWPMPDLKGEFTKFHIKGHVDSSRWEEHKWLDLLVVVLICSGAVLICGSPVSDNRHQDQSWFAAERKICASLSWTHHSIGIINKRNYKNLSYSCHWVFRLRLNLRRRSLDLQHVVSNCV